MSRVVSTVALLAWATLAACSGGTPEVPSDETPSDETPSADAAVTPPDATYPLRGVVVALPRPESKTPHLSVYHEAIPDFVSRDGEVVGMSAMTMPFALGPDVDLAGIDERDKIAATLEIRWDAGEPATLVAVTELPADAVLAFEAPR